MVKPVKPCQGLYPIGMVAEMTGINAITLRAWERRYHLVVPQRTISGRRLYSQADVDCIKEIRVLMGKGIPIGQMSEALRLQNKTPEIFVSQAMSAWQQTLCNMTEAIAAFDETRLEHLYNETLALYPVDLITKRVLLPLLEQLGDRWETGASQSPVSEEHFFACYLRNKLGARFHHNRSSGHGPVLLTACLPGEFHEIGLLIFALAAQEHNYRVISLGADMPLTELPVTARRCHAEALVLSGSVTPNESFFANDLPELCIQSGIPIFIGGKTAIQYCTDLTAAGAIPTSDNIDSGLKLINNYFGRTNRVV